MAKIAVMVTSFCFFLTCLYAKKIISPAKIVSVIVKASLSTISVASESMPKQDPIIKNCAGRPSRNMAINKLRYTSAKPSSCCKIESAAGVSAIIPAINCDFKFEKSTS